MGLKLRFDEITEILTLRLGDQLCKLVLFCLPALNRRVHEVVNDQLSLLERRDFSRVGWL